MRYISVGVVIRESTEHILWVTHGSQEFQLTGMQAALWLNGRFGFSQIKNNNIRALKELQLLKRMELIVIAENESYGEYRALTKCVICPVMKRRNFGLSRSEKNLLNWIENAGLRLSIAELIFLQENKIEAAEELLGPENTQSLVAEIYTRTSIMDNILENQMEHAAMRDKTVKTILVLLKKKRIILL